MDREKMTAGEFAEEIIRQLPYAPNAQQTAVVGALARFCSPEASENTAFILNGYAGTGKTSLTGALVRALPHMGLKCVLMAPTGRAAKVFGAFARRPAFTIHRKIYRHTPDTVGQPFSSLQTNNMRDTLFIVDEASMIGGDRGECDNLLDDLVQYVYSGDNCRLLLIGDTAQLPPVGSSESPAMEPDALRAYGLKVGRATLTATQRQGAQSGILHNATALRRAMAAAETGAVPQLTATGFPDVHIVAGEDLPEMLDTAYARDGLDQTLLISRSNRRAMEYNLAIRSEVMYREEMLTRDELLIVAKNNYHWAKAVKGLDFVANGDIVRVEHVYGTETRYGLRFADVRLAIAGSKGEAQFEAKIILDTLTSDTPALPYDASQHLYESLMRDPDLFEPAMPMDLRSQALRINPYWNALQVKYAYAMTCHKAQGGQWQNVFVDLSYIPDDALGLDLYRWLYTAVSRARGHLYLISPPTPLLG